MAMVKRINNIPTVRLAKQALPLLANPKIVNKAIDVVPLVVQGGQKLSKAAKRLLGAYGGNISYTEGAKPGDAGMDLVATSHEFEKNAAGRRMQVYGTGLAFEIPEGYVGLIFPRSSIAKTDLALTNCVGVIVRVS